MLVLGAVGGISPMTHGAEKVTDGDIQAVVIAIEDEIYANGYHTAYIDIAADKVPVYVNPQIENGMVWVIYPAFSF